MKVTNEYTFNVIDDKQAHNNHFKVGSWYKSMKQNIFAKYSGDPEKNKGYWSKPKFPDFNIRMITPAEWQLVR